MKEVSLREKFGNRLRFEAVEHVLVRIWQLREQTHPDRGSSLVSPSEHVNVETYAHGCAEPVETLRRYPRVAEKSCNPVRCRTAPNITLPGRTPARYASAY